VHILVYFVKSNKLVVDLELPALCAHWEIDDKTGISKGDPASLIGQSNVQPTLLETLRFFLL